MYIATKHIGNKYMPGETIPDCIPADTLEWLIEAGAVRESASAPFGARIEPAREDVPMVEPQDMEPEMIDEEEVAPEIDAMAGVVKGEEDAPAKRPRSSAPNGKKAPKGGKTK